MLRIERIGKRLVSFASLKTRSLEEFYELSDFIANSTAQFFGEIGESLLLVANGLRTADDAESYVDALGVDKSGTAVIVIISPVEAKSPLTRAISSASRIAGWDRDELLRRIGPAESQNLRAYLAENYRELNKQQRVLLIAESFSQQLLGTASWLSGSYGVDIACVEVTLAYDSLSGDEFLNCRLVMGRPVAELSPEPVELEPDEPDTDERRAEEPSAEPPVSAESLANEPEAEEPADLFDDLLPEPGDMPEDLFGAVEQAPAAESSFSPEGRIFPRRT